MPLLFGLLWSRIAMPSILRGRATQRMIMSDGFDTAGKLIRRFLAVGFLLIFGSLLIQNMAETAHLLTMSRPEKIRYLEMQLGRAYAKSPLAQDASQDARIAWLADHRASVCADLYHEKAADLTIEETDILHFRCQQPFFPNFGRPEGP